LDRLDLCDTSSRFAITLLWLLNIRLCFLLFMVGSSLVALEVLVETGGNSPLRMVVANARRRP
jgi:hypothetical protein